MLRLKKAKRGSLLLIAAFFSSFVFSASSNTHQETPSIVEQVNPAKNSKKTVVSAPKLDVRFHLKNELDEMAEFNRNGKYKKTVTFFEGNVKSKIGNCNISQCMLILQKASNAYMMLQNMDEALSLITLMEIWVDGPEARVDKLINGKVRLAIAQAYARTGKYNLAVPQIRAAIEIYKDRTYFTEEMSIKGLSTSYTYGGNTYYVMGDYETSIDFYKHASPYVYAENDLTDIALLEHNMASAYYLSENWDLAKEYGERAIVKSRAAGSDVFLAYSSLVLAKALNKLSDPNGAILAANESIRIFEEQKDQGQILESLAYRTQFQMNIDEWGSALNDTNKMEEIINGKKLNIELDKIFEVIFLVNEHYGNSDKALTYHKKWADLSIKKLEESKSEDSARLLTEFETDLAKERAEKLQKEVDLKVLSIEKNAEQKRVMIVLILVSIFGLFMMVLFFYRERLMKEKMSHLALTDLLTGVPNRRSVMESGEVMIGEKRAQNKPMCIALIDLDYFKKINDTYGHDVGDQVLVNFAKITNKNLRDSDTLGRYGGEEFILLLPDAGEDDAQAVFDRIQDSLALNECEVDGKAISVPISMSMGAIVIDKVRLYTDEQDAKLHLRSVISRADELVYKSKASGRGRLTIGKF